MNKTTVTCTLFVFILMWCAQAATAQPSPQHPTRFVVIFDQSATQSDINDFLTTYNSTVEWISPGPIGAYLLEVNSFPVIINLPNGTVENLVDINEVTASSGKKSKVKSSGVDYEVYLPWMNTPDNPAITTPPLPPAYLCPSGSVNTQSQPIADIAMINIGFLDTGIGGDFNAVPAVITNPVDDVTLFDPYINTAQLGTNVIDRFHPFPADDHGHGTHVQSIAANALKSSLYPYQFPFTNFKTHDANGVGFVSDVIYAIDEGITKNVRVFNASIGYNAPPPDPQYPTPFQIALEYCEANDIIFVAAAGNDGQDNDLNNYVTFPASYDNPNLIAVAAMDCDYALIPQSNYGMNTVDIAAPGHMIKGAHIYYNGPNGSNLVVRSGTSMAVPFVAAVAARGLAHPSQPSAKAVICAILSSALPSTHLSGQIATGGYINGPGVGAWLTANQGTSCDFVDLEFDNPDEGFDDGAISDEIRQWEVFPNPFDQSLVIRTALSTPQEGRLRLLDATGRLVEQRVVPEIDAGQQQLEWELPATLPKGIYFLQLQAGAQLLTRKVIRQ
jgi:subtilisin family serine protease